MFTGIIENISEILDLSKSMIVISNPYTDLKEGESISVDGVCLTVTRFNKKEIDFNISSETYDKTTFRYLKKGLFVNVERALKLGDRIGGHIVTGHVDEVGTVYEIKKENETFVFSFKISDFKYIAEKGSVSINGISLTPFNLRDKIFDVAVISHTYNNTNLKFLKKGDFVNIEFDILAKYIKNTERKTITLDFLKENGYL